MRWISSLVVGGIAGLCIGWLICLALAGDRHGFGPEGNIDSESFTKLLVMPFVATLGALLAVFARACMDGRK